MSIEDIPAEIMTDIVCRLPTQSIIKCKFVCKAWRDLVIHHVRVAEPQVVVLSSTSSSPFKFEDSSPERLVINLTDHQPVVRTSAKGLLLMYRSSWQDLSICNPITREYVRIAPPPLPLPNSKPMNVTFGFGVSTRGDQYKVVRIIEHEYRQAYTPCQVYTLGTGWWRTIPEGPSSTLYYKTNTMCALVGGNLHWLASNHPPPLSSLDNVVSCFDLDTEVFTSFSCPPRRGGGWGDYHWNLFAFEECLGLSEMGGCGTETIIWLMRDGTNWTKHFVIMCDGSFPIKHAGDVILMGDFDTAMLCYFSTTAKSTTYVTYSTFDPYPSIPPSYALVYTPNFVPLKTLLMDLDEEEVISF